MTLPSKRLQREEFWYRELCSVYPYGLNDNVKGVGNVSSMSRSEDLIVYTLLTLGAHAPEGYSTWSVCLCVCVCVCVCVFSLFWHLAQSGVQTAVSATSARYGHEI